MIIIVIFYPKSYYYLLIIIYNKCLLKENLTDNFLVSFGGPIYAFML